MPKPNDSPAALKTLSQENLSQRQKISADFNKANEPQPEKKEEPVKATPSDFKPTDPPADKGSASAAPAAPQAPKPGEKEPEPAKPGEPGKKEEETKVPLAALHEAREKHRESQKQVQELQEQVKMLLGDLKELHEKKAAPAEPETIDDYDKTILNLQQQVKDLTAWKAAHDKNAQADQVKQAQESLKVQIKSTAQDLDKEGLKGFEDLLPMVTAELQRMAATGEEGRAEAVKLDNPEGWKKIFKDIVHPKMAALHGKQAHDSKKNEKEDLKKDAGLLLPGNNPTAPEPEKKDEGWTYETYMKLRMKQSPQPQSGR